MPDASPARVRALGPGDADWCAATLAAGWGTTTVARRGELIDARALPGLVAIEDGRPVGLLTYRVDALGFEVVTLQAVPPGRGTGRSLIGAAIDRARHLGLTRLWLITTNDNARAIAFYEHLGLTCVAVHEGRVAEARRLKPSIPLTGEDGTPITDELELELPL